MCVNTNAVAIATANANTPVCDTDPRAQVHRDAVADEPWALRKGGALLLKDVPVLIVADATEHYLVAGMTLFVVFCFFLWKPWGGVWLD